MGRVMTFEEFGKVAKVGMKVKAAEGRYTACNRLEYGKIQEITEVDQDLFRVNGCAHSYHSDSYLELLDEEKTLDNLEVGDVLVDEDGDEYDVLAVVGKLIGLSGFGDGRDTFGRWWALEELKNARHQAFKIKQQTTEPEITELTLDQIAEKFGVEPSQIRVKKGDE